MTSGYVLTYDASSSATAVPEVIVQRIHRPFVGAVRDVYVEVPGRDSSWMFNEEPGDGTLTCDITLVAASNVARRASVRALSAWAAKRGRKKLIIDDEPTKMWWAKLASAPDVEEAVYWGKLALEWRVQPYAESVDISSQAVSATVLNATTTFSVPGEGIVRMAPVIECTVVGSAPTGIAFQLNGTTIGTTEALINGDIRSFSTLTNTVTVGANGTTELDANTFGSETLAMALVSGDFAYLIPGNNTFKPTRGSMTVSIKWRRRYA